MEFEVFVIWIWKPAEVQDATPDLRGLVEHVGSGPQQRFACAEELLALFEECLETRDESG